MEKSWLLRLLIEVGARWELPFDELFGSSRKMIQKMFGVEC